MKLKDLRVGVRLKNRINGDKFSIKEIMPDDNCKKYLINGLWYFFEEVKKEFKLLIKKPLTDAVKILEKKFPKESKQADKIEEPRKRILYSWVKNQQGRCYKAMLAMIAEKVGYADVVSGTINFATFAKKVITKTNKIFPSMYPTVKKFYQSKGRNITEAEFYCISMGRLTAMIVYDKSKKEMVLLQEHPKNNETKYADTNKICSKILEKEKSYDDFYDVATEE